MRKKRKLTLAVVILAIMLVVAIGFTIAYLTDQRKATNILGLGVGEDGTTQSVMISLTEPSFAAHADDDSQKYLASDATTGEITEATASNLLPGDRIYKDPTIKNVGADKVFLRVKLDITASQMEKLEKLDFSVNTTDFELGADGFYYYTAGTAGKCAEFAPGTSVDFFVTDGSVPDKYSMEIPEQWENSDIRELLGVTGTDPVGSNAVFNLPITAQAIQARNYEPVGLTWPDVGTGDLQSVVTGDRP